MTDFQPQAQVVFLDLPEALRLKLCQLRKSCDHLDGDEHKRYVRRWADAVEELITEHQAST